ncbi:MAG: hypothetical protein Q4F17_00350 [Eubacteriales bacterium]|nr:hypothetical protein [Eubacteriales bacterium]
MGISILELVISRLRQENFQAAAAYPGQKFPPLTGPVAAVHIDRVDRSSLTVTVEVSVLCPAAMGGAECELEALRATEVLRWLGAECVQNGCIYDGVAQVYAVSVMATFTAVTGADSYQIGPGFYIYINDYRHTFVTGFSARQELVAEPQLAMGERAPVGIRREPGQWLLELEELIPAGSQEAAEPEADFEIKVITDVKTEIYSHCDWTSVSRTFTRDGLRRVRKGFALDRRVLV